tara:strand:- start:11 stop:211 length:201 start_codon:yes stop_codon:yes gene_type:complete
MTVPAFLLYCTLNGVPAGTCHFASVNTCMYFRDFLHNQNIKMLEETKNYQCFCRLVNIDPKQVRLH